MPIVCRFHGITIQLNWREHNPPHFHATHAGFEASYAIQDLELMQGQLPPRAQAMVLKWAAGHRQELLENWKRVQNHQPPIRLSPLK